MILFAADNHYGQHPGRVLHDMLKDAYEIDFYEDDWRCFDNPDLAGTYDLVILNLISGSCDVPAPADTASAMLQRYVLAGKPLLLLHGASAAFWQWDWWRPLTGLRWVRGNDPDGFASSAHPVRPYQLRRCKTRHPLAERLAEADLPEDEIYIHMEQTCPIMTLLETATDEGVFPQCYEAYAGVPGRILGYIPGHCPDVVGGAPGVANCRVLIDNLLETPKRDSRQ